MATVIPAVSWLGTALQLAGALGLAERILTPTACYRLMLPGAILWLGVALAGQDWPLVALQFAYVGINVRGFVKWGTW